MALSSFQKATITQQELTAQAVNIATEIERMRARWEFWTEYMALLSATDATELGYTTPEIQALANLRTAVGNVVTAIDGETILDEFRRVLVS
jgi:hypothetical protein